MAKFTMKDRAVMENYTSPLKVDYASKYEDNPRDDLIEFITEPPEIILEIGCGTGATGEVFKKKFPNLKYFGIEYNEGAAEIAKKRLNGVISGDIEKIELDSYGLPKGRIGLIICADVLEHLYDPWKTLYTLRDYLKPGGKIIASIPNTQNLKLILHLLNGNWTYKKYGLLDATHIRFFTLNEIADMFNGTGYKILNAIPKLNIDIAGSDWPKDWDVGKIVIKNVTEQEAIRLGTGMYIIEAQKTDAEFKEKSAESFKTNSMPV